MGGAKALKNILRIGRHDDEFDTADEEKTEELRRRIEPWLSAIFQSEHLAVLVGSGFSIGMASMVGHRGAAMSSGPVVLDGYADLTTRLEEQAKAAATKVGRAAPNIEDRVRVTNQLIGGLRIQHDQSATEVSVCESALRALLGKFLKEVLEAELAIKKQLEPAACTDTSTENQRAASILKSFLLSFASRAASRERLNIFTTNYDRVIEYGCDLAGIRILDRFVGQLSPVFRASRLDIDYHYNPPGIRGEPRYLEGVVKISKLHGSIDWKFERTSHYPHGVVRRLGIPFGAPIDHAEYPKSNEDCVMIYPNAAKDVETLDYPYAELFRDFAASVCRPNTAVLTYGYGFGDDHVNRVLRDMLTIPSTHLVIITFNDAAGRIPGFIETVGNRAQVSLLQGPDLSSLPKLVDYYLPKPAVDQITFREADLRRRREPLTDTKKNEEGAA